MKNIIQLVLLVSLFSLNAKGAFVQINNLSGTAAYGSLTATVTSTGSVTTWSSWCATSFGTSFWAGNGIGTPGSYTFTLNHPVYSLKVLSYALNGGPTGTGEYLKMTVNGAFHPLTATEMTSYSDCGSGAGPCYLSAGLLYGPAGSSSDYNGGDFVITTCGGISSFDIYCDGSLEGVTYYVFVDTTFGGCFGATNNGPICFGDTLKLNATGGDSTLPYTWFGPGGYTSTTRNPVIPNSTFADSGTFFVVQTTLTGIHDTAWTHVVIKPVPVISASNNGPLCPLSGIPLNLTSTPFVAGETFSWSGPSGFTSALQNPSISPFSAADSGTYTVIVNLNGCKDTATTHVKLFCFSATNNSAICLGDTLKLMAQNGDSTLPYLWHGPGGITITGQNPVIPHATLAYSGLFFVVQVIGGINDTAWTTVLIKPLPTVVLGSNSPLCTGTFSTLNLTASYFAAGETFAWTGPNGFSSALQNPTVPGYTFPDTGWYHVVTTLNGCSDSAQTYTILAPIPPAPPITGKSPYCFNDAFVPFNVTGTGILWYTNPVSGTGVATPLSINTSVVGTTTYWVTQTILGCVSSWDSVTVTVLPQILPSFTYAIHRGCTFDTVYFNNTSANASLYFWSFGDNATSTAFSTMHLYPASYPYTVPNCFAGTVTLLDSNGYCSAPTSQNINTSHPIQAFYRPSPDTICLGGTITFVDSSSPIGLAHLWSFGDGFTDNTIGSVPHTYNTPGVLPTKLVVTDSIGCKDSIAYNVAVITFYINSNPTDTTLCQTIPFPLAHVDFVNFQETFAFTHTWTPAAGFPTGGLSNDTAETPMFFGFGNYEYILTDTLQPYKCIAHDTIRIHSILGAKFTNYTPTTTIKYGSSLQLNSDNEVFYTWLPNDGTIDNPNISNPIVTPATTTTYTVFGRDNYGCLDSVNITVIVDSTVYEFLPAGFSPNGDGLNDVFRPWGLTYQKMVEFRVFNRWGQQVFYSSNKENGWDGRFNGVPQDIGTYYYEVIFERPDDKQNIMYKGEVTLIR